jgi:hypothetical protein
MRACLLIPKNMVKSNIGNPARLKTVDAVTGNK